MRGKNSFIRRSVPVFLLVMFLPMSAWAVDYHVALTGSNTNDGSSGNPWKSVTHALSVAVSGDTIHVANGTYSAIATAESFPLVMKEGVNLSGADKNTTILDGGNAATVVSADGLNAGSLSGFTITNGRASIGGGIKVTNCGITISNNIIKNNEAGSGGGIYASEGASIISGNQIIGNRAEMFGGGLYVIDFAGEIARNIIRGNEATKGSGGGIYVVNFSGKLNNNLVVKNVADAVGGIYASDFDAGSEVVNNTIADNVGTLAESVGGMQVSDVSSGLIANNIFWNNGADDLFGGLTGTDTLGEETIGISYSLIDDYAGANSNIYTNPLFVDPANNNYQLNDTSPAIDAGTAAGAPTVDLDGNLRPQGAGVDMGVYEHGVGAPEPGGGTIIVRADKHTIGAGDHPGSTKEPFSGLTVNVFDKSAGSCAAGIGLSWRHYADVVTNCTPDYTETTVTSPSAGSAIAQINVAAGTYLIIGDDGSDKHLGTVAGIGEGQTITKYLQQLITVNGKKINGKTLIQMGSQLLIIQPEYVEWDGIQELYPFVFESLEDWRVTVNIKPPDGFVADYKRLSEEINNETEVLQFTLTDEGSKWRPTKVIFNLKHKLKKIRRFGKIGVVNKNKPVKRKR